jgi:hypothetical protein
MNKIPEAIEIFNERQKFYKSVDLRTAAVNCDNSWYNIRTRILLSADESPGLCEKTIDVEDFVLINERLKADEFGSLLQKINTGQMEMYNLTINFFTYPPPPLNVQDHYRGNSLESKERWNIEWPVDMYEWEQNHKLQNQLSDIFKVIDMQLQRFDPPFKDVEEAIIDLLGLPKYHFQKHYSRDSRCSILLPSFIAIESVKLEGNEFKIIARFHEKIRLEDLSLSVIGYGRETYRHQENFEQAEVETFSPFVRVSTSFKISDVADVQLYLFSKQMEKCGHSDQRSTRNVKSALNPRVASHEVFDPASAKLLQWLGGKAKRDVKNSFEYSVTTLLHMCGFRTEWLDFHGMAQDAPDILAFCEEPELVIIGECTQEIPDINKYKSLKERTEKLHHHLRINTCAVMFTSLNASYDEQNEAWKYDVSFVGLDKLKELHDMATRDKPLRDTLYILTGRNW